MYAMDSEMKRRFGMGNVDAGEGSAGIARNVLQTYCSDVDISLVSDSEILTITAQKAAGYVTQIEQLKDKKSAVYQQFLKEVGDAVCQVAKAKRTTATPKFSLSSIPDWFKWVVGGSAVAIIAKKVFFKK